MQLVQIPDWMANLPVMRKFKLGLPTAAAASAQKGDKMITIVNEFQDRSRKHIKAWRESIDLYQAPENPKTYTFQDLLDYLLMDAHTHSQVQLRNAATLNTRFYVYDKTTGDEQPEKTAGLQQEWFYNALREILIAAAKGYTVLFLEDPDPVTWKLQVLPRRNVIPQKSMVLQKVNDDYGINYKEPIFQNRIIEVIHEYPFGYLNDVAPQIIWKMNAQQSWAEFAEKFGMPGVIAITDKSDTKSLDKIQDLLKTLGESLTAALPRGTEIQTLQFNAGQNGHKVYDAMIDRCNSEISKRILGGTMVSDNGSSLSQSAVHERNLDEKIAEQDKRMIEFVITNQLFPMLMQFRRDLKITDKDGFAFDRSQNISLTDHWKIVEGVLKEYDIDEEWVKKTFQVPITGRKQNQQPVDPNNTSSNFNKASKSMAAALEAKGVSLPKYKHSCCSTKHKHPTAGSFTDGLLEELSDILLNELWNGKDTLATEVIKSIAGYRKLLDGLFEGWSNRMQVSYDVEDHHCLSMMEYNLFEFSRLKERANTIYLNQLLIDKEANNIRTFTDFRNKALPYLQNADVNWLRTEYNQAIAVGQNASRYHQFMRERTTVSNYVQWHTVGDSHVRPAHALMEGRIFRLDDPSGLTIWPPKDWGCRCEMLQYLGDVKEVLSNDEALKILGIEKGSQWDVNRGKIEQVFLRNEMYSKANLNSEASKISFNDYNLPEIKDMIDLPELLLDKSITSINAKELFKPEEGKDYMGFKDYLNRKMVVTERTFDKHSQGHYINDQEQRHRLFPHVKEVLNNPDEVYFVKYGRKDGRAYYQTNYIKFFDGKSLVVNTQTGSEHLEVNTWYINDLAEEKMRQGYLIHKKQKP